MSKAIYVPAQGEQLSSVYNRKLKYQGKDGKEYDLKYFTEAGFFNYDYMLQSCYYGINGVFKKQPNTFKDNISFGKDKILIGDSAGFQIASFKKKGEVCNIEPIDSLRWQEANVDIGMNLDIPPNLDGSPSFEEFNTALKQSVKNFELFEKERKNYDMKLYNVLHGETIPLLELWYNKVKHFKFDGWAIGIKPPFDPMLQALGFCFLHSKGEYEKESCYGIHFFGTSGRHVVPTLVYAANKVNLKMVSYDSSSYNIGSIYRTYYSSYAERPHLSFGDKFKECNPEIKELPCMCPVCSKIKNIEELNSGDIYAGTLISLHNMYMYIQFNQILNSLVHNKEKFMTFLEVVNANEKVFKSIEFIDYYFENGLTLAVQKFEKWLTPQELNKGKQVGIFNF